MEVGVDPGIHDVRETMVRLGWTKSVHDVRVTMVEEIEVGIDQSENVVMATLVKEGQDRVDQIADEMVRGVIANEVHVTNDQTHDMVRDVKRIVIDS
ncbi:hypothetical protein RJT34_32646 [Clitoria ternatea]|uniref:Uncharacterized protein n=1 Tax=Clitoria ternatea TaxID=43366 RepID=A0AAN9I645_CLITE